MEITLVGVLLASVVLLVVKLWQRRSEAAVRGHVLSKYASRQTPAAPDLPGVMALFGALSFDKPQLDYASSQALLSGALQRKQLVDSVEQLKRPHSELLFDVHRLIGTVPEFDCGFGTRVTVQLNLFGGSVANLGNAEQVRWLQGVFDRGELGSFLLTERGAGVLSGLIVQTTASYDAASDKIVLHSPDPATSAKYWISQGYTARWGVVIARLLLNGGADDRGPHAFIVDLTAAGVHKKDMPPKTAYNSLDNCEIWFERVPIERSAMLGALSYLDAAGKYQLVDAATPFSFYRVAQRLLSGRIALACSAIEKLQTVVDQVERYTRGRLMPVMGSQGATMPMRELPSLAALLASFHAHAAVYDRYLRYLAARFADDVPLSGALVHEIACAKILVLDFAIRTVNELKARVGAYSLVQGGAFDPRHTEVFYFIRFAEGDSGILAQKMAADAMAAVASPLGLLAEAARLPWLLARSLVAATNSTAAARLRLAVDRLALAARLVGKKGAAKTAVWLASHALVEKIARRFGLLTVHDVLAKQPSLDKHLLAFFAQSINAEQ